MMRMFTSTHTASQNQSSVRWTRSILTLGILLLLAAPVCAQTGTVAPVAKFTGFDSNGDPLSSGKLCTYTSGTTTAATTYTSATLGAANTNPVILDSAGRADVWLVPGQSYKFVLRSAGSSPSECTTGTIQWTVDGIGAVPTSSNNLDVLGTVGEAITAGQAVYLSDGSGSKTAGQWYKTDATLAYASTTGIVGLAPSAISSTTAGTIRLQGTVTGLSALTVGASYYLSASTPGAITATAPTNLRRPVGVADTTSSIVLNANPNVPPVDLATCDGRLTLESNVPVSTTDQTAKTTLYWTPYFGNRCALYDGTWWTLRTFAQLSIVIPATTAQLYDVYLYDNAGTLALELNAWTNDTTPATAHDGATFYQDGVPVKAGTPTRRFLGVMRTTTVSGQSEDSLSKRLVWNVYHRLRRPLRVLETTNSWAYSVNTFRQANGSTANQVAIVVGVAEGTLELAVRSLVTDTSALDTSYVAIGAGSTTTPVANARMIPGPAATGSFNSAWADYTTQPAIGYQFYTWLEKASAVGVTTWYGDNGGTSEQTGLVGWIDN